MQTQARSAPNSTTGRIDWRKSWKPLLIGLLIGFLLGFLLVFSFMTMLSAGTKQDLVKMILLATRGGVAGIITTVFTYFLINRYLRRREKEVDVHVLAYFAEAMFYFSLMADLDLAVEDVESYQYIYDWVEEKKSTQEALQREDLREFLAYNTDTRRYLRTATGTINEIRATLTTISSLLSICSPKIAVALASTDLFYTLSQSARSTSRYLTHGEWSFSRLEDHYRYMTDDETLPFDEFDDIAEDFTDAIKEVYDESAHHHQEAQEAIAAFLQELPQSDQTQYQEFLASYDTTTASEES